MTVGRIPNRSTTLPHASVRPKKPGWAARGTPNWTLILPLVREAIETFARAPKVEADADRYIARVTDALPKISREVIAHQKLASSGQALGLDVFQTLKRLQWSWAEVVVKAFREHPDAQVAGHFCFFETYHLNSRENCWTTRGRLDRDKLRRGIHEACCLLVARDGALIDRFRLQNTRLSYGDTVLGDRVFEFFGRIQEDWRDFLPWWAEHFMNPHSERVKIYPARHEAMPPTEISQHVLSRIAPLQFLAADNVPMPQAVQRTDGVLRRLTVPQTKTAHQWWREHCPAGLLQFDPLVFPPGYAVTRYALQNHRDRAFAAAFADLELYHFKMIRPRAWFLGTPETAATFYQYLNEVFDLMELPSKRDAVTRHLQYRGMRNKPLKHGARFSMQALLVNAHMPWKELVLESLRHHRDPDLRHWVQEQGDAILDDSVEKDLRKQAIARAHIERLLGLPAEPADVKPYVDTICAALQKSLPTDLHACFHADYEGRTSDLICRSLRQHPNAAIARAFRFLQPWHFAWRWTHDWVGEDGGLQVDNVAAVVQEALTLRWAAATGGDADTTDPFMVARWVRANRKSLTLARMANTALRYQGKLRRHFFRVLSERGYGMEQLISLALSHWEKPADAAADESLLARHAVTSMLLRESRHAPKSQPADSGRDIETEAQPDPTAIWRWVCAKFQSPAERIAALLLWSEKVSIAYAGRLTNLPFDTVTAVLVAGRGGPDPS